jgi:hypothetical protein
MSDVAWGDSNDGANAIIAKDGFNDGVNKGLDVRQMHYIHFDIWSSVATSYPELRLNDTPAGSIVLDGTGWQSFDIDISGLTDEQKSNIRWIKFIAFRDPAPEDIVIDNVYFWSYGVTPNAAQGTDAGGWATFASPVDLAVPAGLTAYKASYEKTETDEILNLTEISVIPANAGVILKGTAGKTYSIPLMANAAAPATNLLSAAVEATDIEANTAYILQGGQFHLVTAASTVPAGKAYLEVAAPGPGVKGFTFNFDDATAIAKIQDSGSKIQDSEIFNLAGQKMSKLQKGVNIVNGKKVLVK